MATRKEILSILPAEVVLKIEANISRELDRENRGFDINDHITLSEIMDTEIGLINKGFALSGAFSFAESEEGPRYWRDTYYSYFL